jgi:FMN phosphatase YigB (HAD superfamily)
VSSPSSIDTACAVVPAAPVTFADPRSPSVRRSRAVWRRAAVRAGRPTVLVLDIGGVVIHSLFETAAVPGFPRGPLGDDPDYAAVEDGRLSETGYWQAVAERTGLDIGELWWRCTRSRQLMLEAMAAVSRRMPVAAFTNDMARWFGPAWLTRFPELRAFDRIIESSRLGVAKPDPEAYRRCVDELGEPAGRCLFVDDQPVNVAAARAEGMPALLFDITDAVASVHALLRTLALPIDPPPMVFSHVHGGIR